ncbi:MAG: ATP-binding protein [Alphaproteobacteria bacterium]|nr:ATP-binding protein [Alphaproteobacteria bacterium]
MAISLFGLITCGALLTALLSFDDMRRGYDHIATMTVPELIAASRIGQTAQAIASTAPALGSVETYLRKEAVNHRITDQIKLLDGYLNDLQKLIGISGAAASLIDRIRESRDTLIVNLQELDDTVSQRITVEARLTETYATARLIMERLQKTQDEQQILNGSIGLHTELPGVGTLHQTWYRPMETVLIEVLAVRTFDSDVLVGQANEKAAEFLNKANQASGVFKPYLTTEMNERLRGLEGEARWLIEGDRGIFGLVRERLELLMNLDGLLNSNKFLANRFVGSVADLTLVLREDTLKSSLAFKEIAYSKWLLLICVMVMSILSVIILSIYARNRIVRRLNLLRDAMIARVSGQTVPIPVDGHDEIADIGQAAAFFTEAVAEREQSLYRAKEEAEHLASEAEAANRAKSVFLANMSHELRTPLNAIIGFSELISTGQINQDRNQEYALDINDSGRHLLELINQLLDYSKIEAGERDLSMRAINASEELMSLEKLIHLQLERRNLTIANLLDPDLMIWADRTAFRQVLLNLLTNSCKFAYEHSTITVKSSIVDNMAAIEIADRGIGIGETHLARVMQPFHQETDTYVRPSGGTGLGLAIVESLIQMHGGIVTLTSEKGVGTSVTVQFQLATTDIPSP